MKSYNLFLHIVRHSDWLEAGFSGLLAGFLCVFLLIILKLVVAAEVPVFLFAAGPLSLHSTISRDISHLLAWHSN